MTALDDTEPKLTPGPTTLDDAEAEPEAPSEPLGEELARLGERNGDQQLEVRRSKLEVASKLFGDALAAPKIGRFTIVRKLGAGGMGVVYVAYDEQLDRRVAVKLLRGTAAKDAQLRFEREAQAMARLSHPNVVTVHEVGTHAGETFVAMEFVDGQDLRKWLAAESRTWSAIVEVFRQAGEGLAAAHDAGIVHRDFKPDNVLVGDDGRVRVADFGLAHGFGEPLALSERPPEDSQGRLEMALTRTGALMGTPAYMPPEQFAGRRTDARGDQFSFCVALWEALHRQRPFVGNNLLELSLAISEGRIEQGAIDSDVPAWLRAILLRGLARAPEQRWPSMRALLDAIGDDPGVRRRRIAARVGIAIGGVALLGALYLAVTQLRHSARVRYWNVLTEDLLQIERERGLEQAKDEAIRARDATRMVVVRNYTPAARAVQRDDPAMAAAILREVEGPERRSAEWLSLANEVLGRPLSEMVLRGHRAAVAPVLFSPDGAWVYSGADDGEVRRWRLADQHGEVIATHAAIITELALSPDGEWLASSGQDGAVLLWSRASGRARELSRHAKPVWSVVFDRAGRRVASASSDGTVRVHDVHGPEVRTLEVGAEAYAVDFDPNGERVLIGASDNRARVWRFADAQPSHVLDGHTQPLFHVRWVADQQVVTAADDGSARLWQLAADSAVSRVVAQHERAIASIDVQGSRLVSGAVDGSMHVSSLAPPYASHELPRHADQVWSVRFTPDGGSVVSASFDKTARLTRADGRVSPQVFEGHHTAVFRAVVDHSGRYLATSSYDTDVRIWDLQRPSLQAVLPGHTDSAFSVEVDAAGERAVTASHDGTARVWSLHDGAALALLDDRSALSPGDRSLNHAVFSPSGQLVATAGGNGDVSIWSLAPVSARRLAGHERQVLRVAFDRQGKRVASASADGTARVWDVETGELALVAGHDGQVVGALFDASGQQLVTASHDASVRVWDLQTGVQSAVLRGHHARVNCVVASPDARVWATGSEDGTARLWPADLRGDSQVLAGQAKSVWTVVFDGAGERVATVSLGQVGVWSVAEASLLATFGTGEGSIGDAEFLPGDRLATTSSDGFVRIWSLADDRQPPLVLVAHGDDVISMATGMDGRALVSVADDGSARLWRIDTLVSDADLLVERLWSATRLCPSPEQRQDELRQAPEAAQAAAEACLGRSGR